MESDSKKRIKIKYEKSKDFRSVAATGAWGGVTPQREIICNFFIEQTKMPENIGLEVEIDTGKIKEIAHKIDVLEHIRELQVGVVMRPDIAKLVGEWLIKKAQQAITEEKTIPKPSDKPI